VERERRVALAEILAQVREIEERGKIARIEREGGIELPLRGGVLPQEVGIDDAAIEMDFFGAAYAAIERPLIGGESRIEAPRPPLQDREVVPAVREIGPAGEQALVGTFRFRQASCPLEPDGLMKQRELIGARYHGA